jgi:HPt (histidine-containing phosphotransfer) domain-containing protein
MKKICLELPQDMSVLDHEQLEVLSSINDDDSDNVLAELITLFIQENEPRFKNVQECCQKKDATELRKHVHFIAGSTANIGLQRVSTLCRQVEKAIMDRSFDAFDDLYSALWAEYQKAISECKKEAKLTT